MYIHYFLFHLSAHQYLRLIHAMDIINSASRNMYLKVSSWCIAIDSSVCVVCVSRSGIDG